MHREQDSRAYLKLKVTADVDLEGAVEIGLIPPRTVEAIWLTAEWEPGDPALVRYARIMVGPDGAGPASVGVLVGDATYQTKVRLSDYPEEPTEPGPDLYVAPSGLTATFPLEVGASGAFGTGSFGTAPFGGIAA